MCLLNFKLHTFHKRWLFPHHLEGNRNGLYYKRIPAFKYISKERKSWAVAIFFCYTVLLCLLWTFKNLYTLCLLNSIHKRKMFTLNRNSINHNVFSFYLSKLICFYFILPILHYWYIEVSSVLWTCLAFSAILIAFLAQYMAHGQSK